MNNHSQIDFEFVVEQPSRLEHLSSWISSDQSARREPRRWIGVS